MRSYDRKEKKLSIKEVNNKCWYKDICSMIDKGDGCHMCTKYFKMNYLMTHSNLPEAKQKPIKLSPTTDNDKKMFKKLDTIRRNIDYFVYEGHNLLIASDNTGNGKTSWAIKLLHKYFEYSWEDTDLKPIGIFVHVPKLLLQLKDYDNPLPTTFLKSLEECDLVVWDDIGDVELSNHDYHQLLSLLDQRMLSERSNIFTSNITTYRKLAKVLGERMASRVFDSSELIILDGGDKRYGSFTDTE